MALGCAWAVCQAAAVPAQHQIWHSFRTLQGTVDDRLGCFAAQAALQERQHGKCLTRHWDSAWLLLSIYMFLKCRCTFPMPAAPVGASCSWSAICMYYRPLTQNFMEAYIDLHQYLSGVVQTAIFRKFSGPFKEVLARFFHRIFTR